MHAQHVAYLLTVLGLVVATAGTVWGASPNYLRNLALSFWGAGALSAVSALLLAATGRYAVSGLTLILSMLQLAASIAASVKRGKRR